MSALFSACFTFCFWWHCTGHWVFYIQTFRTFQVSKLFKVSRDLCSYRSSFCKMHFFGRFQRFASAWFHFSQGSFRTFWTFCYLCASVWLFSHQGTEREPKNYRKAQKIAYLKYICDVVQRKAGDRQLMH